MGDTKTIVEMMKKPKFYQRGKGTGEESLDDITNVASGEILGDTDYKNIEDLEKKCIDSPDDSECKDFLSKGQSLDLAITNVETNMNLKRELEVERVKKIKKDIQELEAYLSDKGHLELLDKLKKKELTADQIETEIAKIYDARKVAEIEALKLRVGSRQIRDDANVDDSDKERIVKENITKTKEEKARMAQVMLFNNIISSQLQMQKKDDSGKTIGDPIANTRGWAREAKELESKGIQGDFFQGVQDFVKENSSDQDSGEIQGVEVIDIILGSKEKSN
jgi:hypothetical protein